MKVPAVCVVGGALVIGFGAYRVLSAPESSGLGESEIENRVAAQPDGEGDSRADVHESLPSVSGVAATLREWLIEEQFDGLVAGEVDAATVQGAANRLQGSLDAIERSRAHPDVALSDGDATRAVALRRRALESLQQGSFLVVRSGSFDSWLGRVSTQFPGCAVMLTGGVPGAQGPVQVVVVIDTGSNSELQCSPECQDEERGK